MPASALFGTAASYPPVLNALRVQYAAPQTAPAGAA